MRAFIAIDFPPAIHRELERAQSIFREHLQKGVDAGARWTRPEGIHLTLKFLGDVSETRVEGVVGRLRHLGPFDEFPVEVKGFGFFPDARRPRVFWAGIIAPPALDELARKVGKALVPLGFVKEAREFTPHLTLARFKTPRPLPGLAALAQEQGNTPLGSFRVAEFFLFESRLAAGKPAEYYKVARFP